MGIVRTISNVARQTIGKIRQIPQDFRLRQAVKRIDIPPKVHAARLDRAFRRNILEGAREQRTGQALLADTSTEQLLEIFNEGVKKGVEAVLAGSNPHGTALLPVQSAVDKIASILEQYQFKTYETEHNVGVSFVQPAGKSALEMAEEINQASQAAYGRDTISKNFLRPLSNNLTTRTVREVVHYLIPVANGTKRYLGNQRDRDLDSHSLASVIPVVLAAGFFRLKKGFPIDRGDIGTNHDPGDLLRGYFVRTSLGNQTFIKSFSNVGIDITRRDITTLPSDTPVADARRL